MKYHRRTSYRKHWKELTSYYGSMCFWCREEIATCIDHVTPYSWDQDNSIENLVPSCTLCNALAGSKIFSDVETKRQYILNRRKYKGNRILCCTECLLPYVQHEHSPSPFMCPRCYDMEYVTSYSQSLNWTLWLDTLETAGIEQETFFAVRCRYGSVGFIGKRQFIYRVLQEIQDYDDQAVALVNNKLPTRAQKGLLS